MRIIYKIFFYLNLIFLPNVLKAESEGKGLGDLMGKRIEYVQKESAVKTVSVGSTIGYGIQLVLSLLATIFLVLIVIAGFNWMTAGGKEEVITKAQKSIKEATIGLAIVLAAYAITWFIFEQLQVAGEFTTGGTDAGGGPP